MDERKENPVITWSAKIEQDTRDSLQKMIAESGKTSGEFISSLLATYETSQNRESISDIRELNQLKNFLARIEEVYVSMAKSRKDIEDSSLMSVTTLQDELRAVKAELHDSKEVSKLEVSQAKEEVLEANKLAEIALADSDKFKESKDRAEKQADSFSATLDQQRTLMADLKATTENSISELSSFKEKFVSCETELQELRNQIKFQVPAEIEKAKVETLKESAKEMKSLHDKIETLQNDKLKLTESLAVEREKVIKLESKPTTPSRKSPAKKTVPPSM